MSGGRVFPFWVFGMVAPGIMLVAFVSGQFSPGAGMFVVLAAAGGWVAFVQHRARKISHG